MPPSVTADPTLDPIFRDYQVVWVRGEPVDAFDRASKTLSEVLGGKDKVYLWTSATGVSSMNGTTSPQYKGTAAGDLINQVLKLDSTTGIVVMCENVDIPQAAFQAAFLKVVENDSRAVFISSNKSPSNFLPTYIKQVHLNHYDIPDAVSRVCAANGWEYDKDYSKPLEGITQYRAITSVLEAHRAVSEDEIPTYLRRIRGSVISQDTDGIITQVEPERTFDQLKGLGRAKSLLSQLAKKVQQRKKVRGCMFAGLPGGGKTVLAFATAKEFSLPLYVLNVGAAFESHVGETEHRIMRALDVLQSLPAGVAVCDELEKSLSSTYAAAGDSGVGRHVGGYILEYLNDPKAVSGYHLVLGTSNDPKILPPEFVRAGRWDTMFWFGYPNDATCIDILAMYRKEYKLDKSFGKDATMTSMTGAEIESVCRVAETLETNDWDTAREYVPVLSQFRMEDVIAMQDWARGRAVSADADTENSPKVRKARTIKA